MRWTAIRLCESLDQGRYFRIRNVVIGSDWSSDVGSSDLHLCTLDLQISCATIHEETMRSIA